MSEERAAEGHLPVLRLSTVPRLYMYRGALSSVCRLQVSQYTARLARR